MNKFLGKIAAGLMAMALIVTGVCFLSVNADEVLASDSNAFHVEPFEVSTYIDADGNKTAPKPTDSDHADWIFAGWYKDAECTTAVNSKSGTRYAKFVPAEVLSVKCQVLEGTKAETTQTSSLRLISTVDSLNYNEVGFEVTFDFGAKTLEIPTYNVFKKIESVTEGQEYGYSPNIFDLQSEYFATATLTNIDNTYFDDSFYIRPYWKTLDGTKVYGVSRCARVEDSYLNIVNVSVRLYSDASVTAGSVEVSYDPNTFTYLPDGYESTLIGGTTTSSAGYDANADVMGKVTVTKNPIEDNATTATITVAKDSDTAVTADGMFVNLRFKRTATGADLPKNNTFAVAESFTVADGKTVVVPDVIYTYYHTEYTGTPDTSWYNTTDTEFVITSPAELYGLAKLTADGTTNFGSKTIYLGADINVNSGTVAEWKAMSDTSTLYQWGNTIGNSSVANWNGIFEGQGHTISGIYMSTSAQYAGLFGVTTTNARINNFKLTNSYFISTNSSGAYMGSVVGQLAGNMESVYSSAVVETIGAQTGGLIARVNPGGSGITNITNCQFAGEITQSITNETANQYAGGIVAVHIQGTLNMTDCLNTGTVTHVYTTANDNNYGLAVGGLLGGFMNTPTITFTKCLNSGNVIAKNGSSEVAGQNGVGSIMGFVNNANVTVKCNNTYATSESAPLRMVHCNAGTVSPEPQAVAKADIASHLAYTTLSAFDFYKTSTGSGRWVTRRASNEESTPALKSFVETNEWFDASWYLDNTSATEYEISTLEELYGIVELSDEVNTDEDTNHTNFYNKTIKLTKNITVNIGTASNWENASPKNDWIPIGQSGYQFGGTFDGQGHVISGIYVNTSTANAGLFGCISTKGTVQNLSLKNSFINSTATSDFANVGSIAGAAYGNFNTLYSDAIVCSKGNDCGGLFGSMNGDSDQVHELSSCWFAGDVATSGVRCGGIVGNIVKGTVKIDDCLVTGKVKSTATNTGIHLGGFVGTMQSGATVAVTNSMNAGEIEVDYSVCVGAMFGRVQGGTLTFDNVYVVTGIYDSCVIGNNSSGTYPTSFATTEKSELSGIAAYRNTNLDFHITDENTGAWVAIKNDTPALKCFVSDWMNLDGAIRSADIDWYTENASTKTYTITTREELYGLSVLSQTNYFSGWVITLGEDIVYNKDVDEPVNEWIPIGQGTSFAGTFGGTDDANTLYTISGISCNTNAAFAGLFGQASGTIKNFRLEDSYFESTNTGIAYIGSVVGFLTGNMDSVFSNATVKAAGQESGGLVGRYGGTSTGKMISNCWFDGLVETTSIYCGGIVGNVNMGTKQLLNCLNTGVARSSYISGGVHIGGLVGGVTTSANATNFTMESCMSIDGVQADHLYCVGTAIGRVVQNSTYIPTVTIKHTYTTENIYKCDGETINSTAFSNQTDVGLGSSSVISSTTGVPAYKSEDNLTGAQARYNTALGFYLSETHDGTWVAREESMPALKSFVEAEEWYTADETIVADTIWYTSSSTSFTITTASELYGFSKLLADNTTGFANATVYLGADIIVNNGDAATWGERPAVNSWTAIGSTASRAFVGSFDGQGYTISGLYAESNDACMGLFGYTLNNAPISNVRLVNTYFEQTGTDNVYLGSILANGGTGSLDSVYSDAILVSAASYVGGILGRVEGSDSYPIYTMNNCWFDGMITSSKQYLGGVLGVVSQSNINMSNCLFTGIINSTYADSESGARVGGLCAYPMNSSVVNMTDCISAGRINDSCSGHTVGSVVGRLSSGSSDVNITNVFATVECSASAIGSVDSGNTNISDILGKVVRATETDRLIGFCTEETEETLDFTNDWVMRTAGVPVLKCFEDFVDNAVEVASDSTLDATLTAQLGLDLFDSTYTLSSAVNYGLGNYGIRISEVELATYNGTSGYLVKLAELGFAEYATNSDSTMDDDGVYNAIYTNDNGNWVVNATYSSSTEELAINISTEGKDNLSKNLVESNVTQSGSDAITLSMLKLTSAEASVSALGSTTHLYYYGNSFVFQLPDGHFIVNDGGEVGDFDGLITYLQNLAGADKKIYIDAWTVSHQHSDHFSAIRGFINNSDAAANVHVEAFYLNEPNKNVLAIAGYDFYETIEKQYQGIYSLTKSDGKTTPDIYWYQTGQRYYFNGITMDVIQSQEQIATSAYAKAKAGADDGTDYNTTSTVLLFTTAKGEKIFIGGDANYVNMDCMMSLYGKINQPTTLTNINVFTALHHGKNTSYSLEQEDNTFTDYLLKSSKTTFDVVLFPCEGFYGCDDSGNELTFDTEYDVAGAFPCAGAANAYLIDKATISKHYGDGTVVVTFGGESITVE